jgi:WD40 repeat protein
VIEHTGRAMGPLSECPELGVLEMAPLAPEVHAHVDVCEACLLVLELLGGDGADECGRYEPLLAARADGALGRAGEKLLAGHLGACESCRALADTLAPVTDTGDHLALPRVDPQDYALGAEIGRGGMGRVLAARDLRVGRPVAVKELHHRSPQLATRFEREARVTARLQHPGIVPIYEIGRWPDGTPFYSMRMVDGRALREAIDEAGTLAGRLGLLTAVIAATEAVAFAHAQRIIHRDLTPSNVLVGAYGETIVIDWGLAKDLAARDGDDDDLPDEGARAGARDSGLTSAGAVIGTAAYMPPEQASGKAVDERADVYALGAILYHLLAGRSPYRGKRTDELVAQVKAGPPPPVDSIVTGAPRDLVSIVGKAMARDARDRYASARELAEELKRFQTGRLVEAHVYTTRERMRRFVARNRAPLFVTALAVVALALTATVAVRRVLRESHAAQMTVLTLLEERGRSELLAGDSIGAIAYLHAAYEGGRQDAPSLRFLLATALRDIATVDGKDLDCAGDVRTFEFSPDGATLAAACHDRAKIWRLSDHKELAALGPAPAAFDKLAFSHDGTVIVTWGDDGVARIWNAATGALVRELQHAPGITIELVTFTDDDTRVATSGDDGWARVWDAKTGTLVRAIHASDALVLHHLYGVLSHDGKRVLTVTIEGIGAGWDVATGERLGGFRHGSLVTGGQLSPDGTRAVTCGTDHLVKVWDATTNGALVVQLAGATSLVWKCVFSPDGKRVLGTEHDGRALVWDIASGAAITSVVHGGSIWTGHFAPDGERFVTVGIDGSVKVWDATTGGLLASHDTQGGKEARFTPDGQRLVVDRGDEHIRIWKRPNGPLRATFAAQDHETIVAVTRDGTRVATETTEGLSGRVTLHDAETGRTIETAALATPIAVSTSAERIAAAGGAGVVVIDARDGRAIASLAVGRPHELALSDDGSRIAIVPDAGAPEVWDVGRGVRLATVAGSRHALLDRSGRRALAWSDDGVPTIWDVDADRAGPQLAAGRHARAVGFSDDGQALVLYETDVEQHTHAVTIWDATTGQPIHRIDGAVASPSISARGDAVTTVLASGGAATWSFADRSESAFSTELLQQAELDPSDTLIAGIGNGGETALVLDATNGRVLARWAIAHDPPTIRPTQDAFGAAHATALWSTDGKTIVTRSSRLAVWNAETELPPQTAQLVHHNVPWQVKDGRLVLALARLHGQIVRGAQPVAGATLELQYRKPPDLGTEVAWQLRQAETKSWRLVTDRDGAFAQDRLTPGEYTITAHDAGSTYPVKATVSVEDEGLVIDLAETRGRSP